MTKPVSIAFVVLILTVRFTLIIVSSEQDCPVKCTCYQHQANQANINRQVVDCSEFEETDLIRFKNLSVDTTDFILKDGTIDFGKPPSHLTIGLYMIAFTVAISIGVIPFVFVENICPCKNKNIAHIVTKLCLLVFKGGEKRVKRSKLNKESKQKILKKRSEESKILKKRSEESEILKKRSEESKILKKRSNTQVTTVGKIKFDRGKILGLNVFKGEVTGERRPIAVKRSPYTKTCRGLNILKKLSEKGLSNNHVIQYLLIEKDEYYWYIAFIPVFDETLHDAIKKPNKIAKKYMTTGRGSCLEQLAEGLKFIHDQDVQHRDIKPENILIVYRGDSAGFIISDFDLGHINRRISPRRNSKQKLKYGTMGWAAPELWKGGKRTTAVDIFSLGCVFYYVLTKGCHPFGEIYNLQHCQKKIISGQPKLRLKIEGSREFKPALAKSLINSMIECDCGMRPKATWIIKHPIFLSDEEISEFYLSKNVKKVGKPVVDNKTETFQTMLKANSSEVYTGDWTSYLDGVVAGNVDRNSDKADICKLLRHIRNKTEHFDELSEKLKHKYYHGCSEGVARYFNEKFPKLLLYTFQKNEELEQQQAVRLTTLC